jgi:hypothetical protein
MSGKSMYLRSSVLISLHPRRHAVTPTTTHTNMRGLPFNVACTRLHSTVVQHALRALLPLLAPQHASVYHVLPRQVQQARPLHRPPQVQRLHSVQRWLLANSWHVTPSMHYKVAAVRGGGVGEWQPRKSQYDRFLPAHAQPLSSGYPGCVAMHFGSCCELLSTGSITVSGCRSRSHWHPSQRNAAIDGICLSCHNTSGCARLTVRREYAH